MLHKKSTLAAFALALALGVFTAQPLQAGPPVTLMHVHGLSYSADGKQLLNHQPNSRMSQAGIHHTLTDGLKWKRAAAKGLSPKLNSLAVHPTDASIVAAGTDDGHRAEPRAPNRDRDRDLQAQRLHQQGPGSDLDANRERGNDERLTR